MYSAIFSLRLLCAIYIGSVVWFNVRQAKIPLFTQKRNRRPDSGPGPRRFERHFRQGKTNRTSQTAVLSRLRTDKTVQTIVPTGQNVPDKSGEDSIPTDASPPLFRSDETVRTTGSNRSNGPDRLNERSAPTDESSGSGRTKRHGASSPPRHLPFHQPPKEPAGASFSRISRSLGTADGFSELSQPAPAYKYTAPYINDIDPRRDTATNAATQTTTKCGWSVRIHRDTGPAALYPKYGNRTVR